MSVPALHLSRAQLSSPGFGFFTVGVRITLRKRPSIPAGFSTNPCSPNFESARLSTSCPTSGMRHLSSSEHHRELYLVALRQQPLDDPHLQVDVVLSCARPQAHLVHHRPALMFTCVPLLLRLLVFPLPVVEQPADGRVAVGVYLDQIEPGFARAVHRIREWDYTHVLPVRSYETDLSRPDPFVYPKLSENSQPLTVKIGTTISAILAHRQCVIKEETPTIRHTVARHKSRAGTGGDAPCRSWTESDFDTPFPLLLGRKLPPPPVPPYR